jgi:hypothetical protein
VSPAVQPVLAGQVSPRSSQLRSCLSSQLVVQLFLAPANSPPVTTSRALMSPSVNDFLPCDDCLTAY